MAERRGRDAEFVEEAVNHGRSITSREAVGGRLDVGFETVGSTGSLYLIAETSGLIVAINLVFVAVFTGFEWKTLTRR